MIINNIRILLNPVNEVFDIYKHRYKCIMENCYDYIKKINDEIISKIQNILDNLSSNISKLEYKADELKIKMNSLESDMDYHYRNYESYKSEAQAIYDAGHMETINYYDDEGNVTSTNSFWDYDYEAHSRAMDNANSELKEYERIKEIYDRVKEVYLKIEEKLEYLYMLKKAISAALDKINEFMYDIKKYTNEIDKEIDYNFNTLDATLKILKDYKELKKFYYDNVVTLHSMFPDALLGVMQTYRNIFYDSNREDKINVSLNKINFMSNEVLNLNSNIANNVRDIDDAISKSSGQFYANLAKLLNNYISKVKDFETEIDKVRSDSVLCFELRRTNLTHYQNHRYIKSNID